MSETKQETDNNKNDEPMIDRTVEAINQVDQDAAKARVDQLREMYPGVAPEAIVGMLIKQKCLQTGAIGNVSSSASVIPGVGVFVSLVFGGDADVALTSKMQAELVQEIALAYDSELDDAEKREAMIMVTKMSSGVKILLNETGATIAQQANAQLERGETDSKQPSLGVSEAAGQNMVSTYLIGQRAGQYFSLGPEAVEDWNEQVEALQGADAEDLSTWLNDTTQQSWQLLNRSATDIKGVAIAAGQSLGELVVVKSTPLGQQLGTTVETATQTLTELGKQTGSGVAGLAGKGLETGADLAGFAAKTTGKGIETAAGFLGSLLGSDEGKKDRE